MAKKAFEIQGANLRIGGVNLQAGTTGVVIPGVTQATTYRVEEVEDTDVDQTTTFTSAPTIIDFITYMEYDTAGTSTGRATYTCELDDDDYLEDVELSNNGGEYTSGEQSLNEGNDLYAYTGSAGNPFSPFVLGDWTQIPFRPKMRAAAVETIGGGNGSLSVGTGSGPSIENVTEILINGTVTEIEPGLVGISVSGGEGLGSITVPGVTFTSGTTYTFQNPQEVAKPWTFRPVGTLVTPAGVILSSDYQAGNPNYRDFTIEMLEPGDAFEHRWIFRNDATLSVPGDIEFSGGSRQSVAYTRSTTITMINAGTTETIGLEGADTILVVPDNGYVGNDTQTLEFLGRNVEGMRTVLINSSSLCIVNFNLVSGAITVPVNTVMEVVYVDGDFYTISERAMV